MSQHFWDADSNDLDGTQLKRSAPQRILAEVVDAVGSDPLLCGAVASLGLAIGLQLAGRTKAAGFVGLCAPTLLMLSIYRRSLQDADGARGKDRRTAAGRELDEHFRGGCASPPDGVGDVDDYSERIARPYPHKAK